MEKVMEKKYRSFAQIWAMFNDLKKTGYTEEGWQAFVKWADEIGNESDQLIRDVILATISEAEYQARLDLAPRKREYKISASAFCKAWSLYENLINCPEGKEFSVDGIRLLADYEKEFPNCTFAVNLGNAVYADACRQKKGNGSFVQELLEFYQRFQDGITEETRKQAYEEAECILNTHPEYTMHVMSMLASLQKAKAAA